MKRTEWNVSAGAVLLAALMYFFDGSGLVSAAVPAVLVHELGHFLAAKKLDVQVNEFSICMGPAIVKKQVGETLYALRCIPLGGYCAMEGEDEETGDPRAFTAQKAWKRMQDNWNFRCHLYFRCFLCFRCRRYFRCCRYFHCHLCFQNFRFLHRRL